MATRGASRLDWCLRRVGASGDWLLLEAGTQVSRAGTGPAGSGPRQGGAGGRGFGAAWGGASVSGAAWPEPRRGLLLRAGQGRVAAAALCLEPRCS